MTRISYIRGIKPRQFMAGNPNALAIIERTANEQTPVVSEPQANTGGLLAIALLLFLTLKQ